MKLKAIAGRIPGGGKAFLLAIGLLLVIHLFVLRWVSVRSTSMYSTLLPGDLLGVERWPIWTGLHRGDVIVFRDPVQDDRPKSQRQLLVKRIVGTPGDEVEIRAGVLYINGMEVPPTTGQTKRWSVRLKSGTDPSELLLELGLPADYVMSGHTMIDLPLNSSMAAQLKDRPDVISVEPSRPSTGSRINLFPFGPNFRWNNDNYGPLRVPVAGDTVAVTPFTLPILDRLISRYEHNVVEISGGELLINGKASDRYRIQKDYYFVLGDSRDHSSDSRYWGFVPADQIVGRAGFVLLNARSWGKHPISGRTVKHL